MPLLPARMLLFTALSFYSTPPVVRLLTDPAGTLGINMLGAVFGGLLENLTMIGGAPAVSVLALLIYIGSAVALNKAAR